MYYIMLQLEDTLIETDKGSHGNPKGDVWSTSFTKSFWAMCPGDSLEKYLEREKAEVMETFKTYKALRAKMIKWHNYCRRNWHEGMNSIDLARKFFKK